MEVSCVDNNSAIVSGAYIQLTNQAGQDARLLKADSSGNAYFRALYYGIWNVLINYTIGTMNYTVLNTSISTITGPAWIFTYTAVCNLTTVSLCVRDNSQYDPAFWGLANANITMFDPNVGINVTSYYTNAYGNVSMELPGNSVWNFTIFYQNSYIPFITIPETGTLGYSQQFIVQNILGIQSLYFNCTVGLAKSQISVISINPTTPWTYSNQTSVSPVFFDDIFIYERFDSISLSIFS